MIGKRVLLGAAALAAMVAGAELAPFAQAPAAVSKLATVGAGAEWHGVNADTAETGFSRLDQITSANATRLGLAWTLELPGEASLEASPIAVDGMIYFPGAYSTVYAVN